MVGELDGEEGVKRACVDQGTNAVAKDGGVDVEERGDVNWTGGGGGERERESGDGFVVVIGGGGPRGGRGRGWWPGGRV